MKILLCLSLALCLSVPAYAQEDPPEETPKVTSREVTVGPVQFHIVPEIGVGLFLKDDQVVDFFGNNGYYIFRIPGLQFPSVNGMGTGIQFEFSDAPAGVSGVRYDISSYTRIKVAGPVYTGVNIRLFQGVTELGGEVSTRVIPVVGLRFLTIAERVPFFIEFEFGDNDRPLKASITFTLEQKP